MMTSTLPLERPADVPAHVDVALLHANLERAWPTGVERSALSVDGFAVPVVTRGRGRPIVCVHGLGHDLSDFTPLFARAPDDLHLVALDLPGFGRASLDSGPVTLDTLAHAVEAVVAELDEAPIVVGSSLGGHVALLVALRGRVRLAGLVLASPGGLSRVSPMTAAVARAYYSESAIVARSEEELLKNTRRIFVRDDDADSLRIAARKLAIHRSPLRRSYARPFASVVDDVFRHPLADAVGRVSVPFVIVHGARDVVVERAPLVAAVQENPLARFVGFDDVGHLPMVEARERFAALCFDFARAPGTHEERTPLEEKHA